MIEQNRQIARDISYAYSAQTRGGRAMIRALESLGGRKRLIKRAKGYEDEVAAGRDFWQVMVERYGVTADLVKGSLASIPRTGPLVLIANHPYGILDGLIMGHLLSQTRDDFRILANSVFTKSAELKRIVCPISFDDSLAAKRLNRKGLSDALRFTKDGGALGIFPSGTVATSKTMFSEPAEPLWPETAASIILATRATCIPVFFFGANSRAFQISSHLHGSLRLGMFVGEFRRKVGKPLPIVIGEPVLPDSIEIYRNDKNGLTRLLRRKTLELGGVSPDIVGRQYLRGV
ncbi:MAG: lysophospholipid acyltransferase family protein [Pseudomonadota bacterium]